MTLSESDLDGDAGTYQVAEWQLRPFAKGRAWRSYWFSKSSLMPIWFVLFLSAAIILSHTDRPYSARTILVLLVLAASGAFRVWNYTVEHRRSMAIQRLGRLVDKPSSTIQFFAELTLFDGRRRYGSDTGVVRVVDGWIVYDGLRTSFSVAASRLKPFKRWWCRSGRWSFEFTSNGQTRRAQLSAFDAKAAEKLAVEIEAAVSAHGLSRGVTVLPPLSAPSKEARVLA